MIEATNISYQAGGRSIVNDISFTALPGELLVILGSNGAGKSTLLKMLCGELECAPGSICINGKSINRYTAADLAKFRAVLQQHTTLTLPFTVYEVVMMGRYPHYNDKPLSADHTIAKQAIEKAGIAHLADRNYLTLSGGEQQRVHLARVFAQVSYSAGYPARYLFMDEPVNSLDILHQHTTLQLAKQFGREGNCVIAVLHDLNLAMQYADKILLMKNGEMVGYGATQQVLTGALLSHAYNFPLSISDHPSYTYPVVMPAFATTN